jgi:hypothetical protein
VLEAVVNWGEFAVIGNAPKTLMTSTDGVAWTPRALPNSGAFNAIACGGLPTGVCTIVGSSGTLLTTSDFNAWTSHSIADGGTNHLRQAAYGASTFVAVGDQGGILTSPDGVTWTVRFSGTAQTLHGVGFVGPDGGDRFVAVGASGTLFTSATGVTWDAGAIEWAAGAQILRAVTFGAGQYVAVGENGTALRSSDGLNWTNVSVTGLGTTLYESATSNGSRLMTVGSNKACTSDDAIAWTCTTFDTGGWEIRAVVFAQGLFVSLGKDDKVRYSPDGVTWDAGPGGPGGYMGTQIAYGGGRFVAATNPGAPGGYVYSSTNGVNWLPRTAWGHYLPDSPWAFGVTYGAGRFVHVGQFEHIMTTP